MNDHFWMSRALLLANRALKLNEIPVGAILTINNLEIANSINYCYLSTFNHSEIKLFNKANFYFSNYYFYNTTLYVTLEPCNICLYLISFYRIKRIVFGAHSNFVLKNDYNNDLNGGIMKNESIFLLKSFFIKNRLF